MRDLINLIETLSKPDIEAVLKKAGYRDLKVSGMKIAVLVQIPDGEKKELFRAQVLKEILVLMKQNFPKSKPTLSLDARLSSIGGIEFADNPVKILVKDTGNQGDKSAGVANEIQMASLLQSVIERYGRVNVTFVDPRGKTLVIDDCTSVEVAGRDTGGRKKADVVLRSPERSLPISIKKLTAEAWESADNLFGKKARGILDQLVRDKQVKLNKLEKTRDGMPVFSLSKEVVIEPTEEEAMSAIFGSDLNPKGGIIIQTFEPEHFVQTGQDVTIEAHAVIASRADIPESHLMVWLLRNDPSRNSLALGIPGIRVMGATLTRGIGKHGTKDVILVDKNGNVLEKSQPDQDKSDADLGLDDLDAVADKRLTGPGAKASRQVQEPKTDAATTGRKRRKQT
jgi:hypothetical protein